MSAAEKALAAVEADTKAMGDEAREIAAFNGDSHLLEVLPSAALRRERYTLALAAVVRAAMAERAAIKEEREGSPFGGPVDPCNGVRAKARRALDAALDAFEAAAAVRSLSREDRHAAAQPAVEGVDDGT